MSGYEEESTDLNGLKDYTDCFSLCSKYLRSYMGSNKFGLYMRRDLDDDISE